MIAVSLHAEIMFDIARIKLSIGLEIAAWQVESICRRSTAAVSGLIIARLCILRMCARQDIIYNSMSITIGALKLKAAL